MDTPLKVAPLGISSVISLVDDVLLEKIRAHYCEQFGLPYERISNNAQDARACRVSAYLDLMGQLVDIKLNEFKAQPLQPGTDKAKYFELLPECNLKQQYQQYLNMGSGQARTQLEQSLTNAMVPGSIDANIMVKLDRLRYDDKGQPLEEDFSDAHTALRGFAQSKVHSSIILSAGINQGLINQITKFPAFYRDANGYIKKKIVIKVSDFRSALIQGRFFAKKGLEVHEYRIESGLNCGGHAFATEGFLLPVILHEFNQNRQQIIDDTQKLVRRFYDKQGMPYPEQGAVSAPLFTVQGGIGTHGEVRRLLEYYKMDRTGWATPFLLVPEVTQVDDVTRAQLRSAKSTDLYLSEASPIGIPFNNMYGTGSELWSRQRQAEGKPGSPCPKSYLLFNTEFEGLPLCIASHKYQTQKLASINASGASSQEINRLKTSLNNKQCICDHLGNSAQICLGLKSPENAPQCICPGPNMAWFTKDCTLQEMVDYIYGRSSGLVPPEREHMFAKELSMYVDYLEKTLVDYKPGQDDTKHLEKFRQNLLLGMDYCAELAKQQPYEGENLASLGEAVTTQKARLNTLWSAAGLPAS